MDKICNNINPNKLQDELILAGIRPILVMNDIEYENGVAKSNIANTTWITFVDGVDISKIDKIIANHNPES